MTRYTRHNREKLAPEIIKAFHEAGQNYDLQAFKRLLGRYGAHLSAEKKDELIEMFKQYADALRAALRGDQQ